MIFVRKILVVLQVVLTLFFMVFAAAVYSVQQNWKADYETLQKSKQDAETRLANDNSNLKQSNAELAQKFAAAENEIGSLQAENEGLERERDQAIVDRDTVRNELSRETVLAENANRESTLRIEEAQRSREQIDSLLTTRDHLVMSVQSLEDEAFNREVQIKKMQDKHNIVLADNAEYKRFLLANEFSIDPKDYAVEKPAPPLVQGMVLDTRRGGRAGANFVEISIGSDDGLQEGHELFVYRNQGQGKYLGKIRIVRTEPDRAVGTILLHSKNGTIERGDNVTTKL